MKKTGTFPGVRKTSSGAEEALTQGMKVNDMRYLSVTVSFVYFRYAIEDMNCYSLVSSSRCVGTRR